MTRMLFVRPSYRHAVVPTLVTGTAATGYVVANLNDGNPANPLILTAAGVLRLQWDLGSALNLKMAAIFNHNISSESSDTITLQANTAASWGAPAQSMAMTRNGPASPDGYRPNTWAIPTWATAYRYVSIVTAGTTALALSVGEIWLAVNYEEMTVNPSWGLHDRDTIQGKRVFETAAGVQWRSGSHGRRRRMTGEVDGTDAAVVTFGDWWRACKGGDSPTVLVPNPDGGGALTYQDDARLVRWSDDADFDRGMVVTDRNTFPVEWVEMARG